jgi:phosphomannomutase
MGEIMQIDTSIFKAYDIRGIYPTQLNEETAYRIGKAYATLIQTENPGKTLNIVVGNDMRLSSPQLKSRLLDGLTEMGVNVIDIGLASTPTFYFAVAFYGYEGGVQVSASHNPKDYNGMKLVRAGAVPVSGETGMKTLAELSDKNQFTPSKTKGTITKKTGILEDLVKDQTKTIDLKSIKPLKIAVDAANAMGSLDIEAMFKGLPCKLVKVNFKLDGTFPSHEADPFKDENLKAVQDAVEEHCCDLGISIDGDGDRYFFVDENGELIRQEILRGIMAQLALKDNPGATVCYDIRPGRITRDMIDSVGGKSSITRVGHSLIKEQMIKENAVFGGESSGHFFYQFDYGSFESPIMYVLGLLEFISEKNQPVSKIMDPYRVYFHSGEINSVVEDPDGKMKELGEKYADAEISHLDGVTITYPNFWFNVRKSNTEPKLRLNLEAKTKETMEQKRDEVLAVIKS